MFHQQPRRGAGGRWRSARESASHAQQGRDIRPQRTQPTNHARVDPATTVPPVRPQDARPAGGHVVAYPRQNSVADMLRANRHVPGTQHTPADDSRDSRAFGHKSISLQAAETHRRFDLISDERDAIERISAEIQQFHLACGPIDACRLCGVWVTPNKFKTHIIQCQTRVTAAAARHLAQIFEQRATALLAEFVEAAELGSAVLRASLQRLQDARPTRHAQPTQPNRHVPRATPHQPPAAALQLPLPPPTTSTPPAATPSVPPASSQPFTPSRRPSCSAVKTTRENRDDRSSLRTPPPARATSPAALLTNFISPSHQQTPLPPPTNSDDFSRLEESCAILPCPATPPQRDAPVDAAPLSHGRGGNGNALSDGDIEANPGPPHLARKCLSCGSNLNNSHKCRSAACQLQGAPQPPFDPARCSPPSPRAMPLQGPLDDQTSTRQDNRLAATANSWLYVPWICAALHVHHPSAEIASAAVGGHLFLAAVTTLRDAVEASPSLAARSRPRWSCRVGTLYLDEPGQMLFVDQVLTDEVVQLLMEAASDPNRATVLAADPPDIVRSRAASLLSTHSTRRCRVSRAAPRTDAPPEQLSFPASSRRCRATSAPVTPLEPQQQHPMLELPIEAVDRPTDSPHDQDTLLALTPNEPPLQAAAHDSVAQAEPSRDVAGHRPLIVHPLPTEAIPPPSIFETNPGFVCKICDDEIVAATEVSRTRCGHVYHRQCSIRWWNTHDTCFTCGKCLSGRNPFDDDTLPTLANQQLSGTPFAFACDACHELCIRGASFTALGCGHLFHAACFSVSDGPTHCPVCDRHHTSQPTLQVIEAMAGRSLQRYLAVPRRRQRPSGRQPPPAAARAVSAPIMMSPPLPQCTCGRRLRTASQDRRGRHETCCAISRNNAVHSRATAGLAAERPLLQTDAPQPPLNITQVLSPTDSVTAAPASFDYKIVARLPIVTMRNIPAACRPAVSAALKACTTDLPAFQMFAKSVLPTARRTGVRHSKAQQVFRHLALWNTRSSAERLAALTASANTKHYREEKHRHVVAAQVRAERLARAGMLTKAARALRPMRIAEVNAATIDSLKSLHPRSEEALWTEQATLDVEAPTFHEAQVITALRSFVAGTAPGPSGLRPEHLLEGCTCPNEVLSGPLTKLINAIARGDYDVHSPAGHDFLFAASLIPLLKPASSTSREKIRPIAIGEVARRLAAKLLLSHNKGAVADYFVRHHQLGIAVKDGCTAAIHATSAVASQLREGFAILKLDFANAFNVCSRSVFLREAAANEEVQHLHPMLHAAYSAVSTLFVLNSDECIASSSGAQQGDGLGPLAFALNAAALDRELHQVENLFRVWIYDDLTCAVPLNQIAELINLIKEKGAGLGLHLNLGKSSIICASHNDLESAKPSCPGLEEYLTLTDNWSLLGAPMNPSHPDALVTFIEDSSVTLEALCLMEHSQTALALLLYSCGFCRAVYLLRAMGPHPDFAIFDTMVLAAFERIVGITLVDDAKQQVQLPISLGGAGLRSSFLHAPVAHLAAAAVTAPIVASLLTHTPWESQSLFQSPTVLHCTKSEIARILSISSLDDVAALGHHAQRKLSHSLDQVGKDALFHSFSEDASRARLNACGGKNTGNWMLSCSGMSNACLSALFRFRLGYPLATTVMCPSCQCVTDRFGAHVAKCVALKHVVHAPLKRVINDIAREANLNPSERVPPLHPPLRANTAEQHQHPEHSGPITADAWIPSFRYGRAAVIDFATTYPLQDSTISASMEGPGCAATAYEAIKVAKYSPYLDEDRHELIPFVMDSFGGFSDSAMAFVKTLAFLWSRQHSMHICHALPLVAGRISRVVMQAFGDLLLRACPAPDSHCETDAIVQSALHRRE